MTEQRIQELRGLSIDTSHVNSNALSECLDAIEVLQAALVKISMGFHPMYSNCGGCEKLANEAKKALK